MPDEWQTPDAMAKVDAFLAAHGGYTREGVAQPGQGATNRVMFARRDGRLVVFKVFCTVERKQREGLGLRHWGPTGMVPELIDDAEPRMIVMGHVPGEYLAEVRRAEGDAAWREACGDVGRAIGRLTRVPLSAADRAEFESRFYEGLGPLEAYLGRIIELGRGVHSRDADFADAFWGRSLAFIQGQLANLFRRPRVLYHQDVGNLHVRSGRFAGFFDLEMCRVGCDMMQLASAIGLVEGEPAAWARFREGWQAATGAALTAEDLAAADAGHQLLCWREITRYMSYDGTPGTGYAWASPADPARYRKQIESVRRILGAA
jgi:hypothetical protein